MSTFGEAIQANYFNSNIGFKSFTVNIFKQALSGVGRSDIAPTVSQAEMSSLVQTKLPMDTIAKIVLFYTGFIVLIAETVGMTVNRAVDEYRLPDYEEALMTGAVEKPSIEGLPLRTTKPTIVPSHSESHEENRKKLCRRCRSSR